MYTYIKSHTLQLCCQLYLNQVLKKGIINKILKKITSARQRRRAMNIEIFKSNGNTLFLELDIWVFIVSLFFITL